MHSLASVRTCTYSWIESKRYKMPAETVTCWVASGTLALAVVAMALAAQAIITIRPVSMGGWHVGVQRVTQASCCGPELRGDLRRCACRCKAPCATAFGPSTCSCRRWPWRARRRARCWPPAGGERECWGGTFLAEAALLCAMHRHILGRQGTRRRVPCMVRVGRRSRKLLLAAQVCTLLAYGASLGLVVAVSYLPTEVGRAW